jgi:hypothetical protein
MPVNKPVVVVLIKLTKQVVQCLAIDMLIKI